MSRDEGIDRNAIALRHGIVLEHVDSWSGKGSDLYATVVKAFDVCDLRGYEFLFYDGDGMGSGVRGDARIINEARESDSRPKICDEPFRGSEPYSTRTRRWSQSVKIKTFSPTQRRWHGGLFAAGSRRHGEPL